nr:hypothetical protein [Tanacetum cinerariifolium]
MAKLDFYNMVAILDKIEHNTDFHQIVDFLEASHIRRITRGTIQISQSKVPSPGADETAFPTGDVRYREAFPIDTSLDAGQDRENITKTSVMPHEALPRVTSLGGGGCSNYRRMDQGEDLLDRDKSAEKGSDSTDATASTGVSPAVATSSGSFPTAAIFTTASVATPTTRVTRSSIGVVIGSSSLISVNIPSISKKDNRKGKVTEPEQPNQIIREQAEIDSEIARIHAEKELEMMIAELDRSNEMVAKYLSKYEQAEAGLSHDDNVELINKLLMYQRHLDQIKKYQAQQDKPATKTERRNFYMSILRSNAVWENMKYFVPMNSKKENKRLKRPGIQLDKERFKKLKTTEASCTEPTQEQQSKEPKELSEEELKQMMKLVLVVELYIKALHVKNGKWTTNEDIYYSKQSKITRCLEASSPEYIPIVSISVPTADVYTAKKFATVEDFALLHEDKIYSESKTRVCYIWNLVCDYSINLGEFVRFILYRTPWTIKGVLRSE